MKTYIKFGTPRVRRSAASRSYIVGYKSKKKTQFHPWVRMIPGEEMATHSSDVPEEIHEHEESGELHSRD